MTPSKNATLLRTLLSKAEALACSSAENGFPVLLRQIAERRRVTGVEFRPLLVDAMLTTHPSGFRILFNSDRENPSELGERYSGECRERLLPSRWRFSLAHELAHTLFYDISVARPQVAKEFRAGGGRTALENLELYCNKLAAQFLLPAQLLRVAFRNLPSVNAETIQDLANRAGVSVEVLVRRLGESSSLFVQRYFRGCIVLTKQNVDKTTIAAVARPEGLNIAHELLQLRSGQPWQLPTAEGIQTVPSALSPASVINLTLRTDRSATTQPYQVSVAEIGRFAHLLVFQELEARRK